MRSNLRKEAIRLRVEKELSYGAIRKRLNVAKSTLSHWLRDFPLSEEKILLLRQKGWKKGEASRERYRNTMRAKKEKADALLLAAFRKQFSKLSKRERMIAGLMLYAAEGGKRRVGQLVVANTNPLLLRFYIDWLSESLKVQRNEVKVQLHLYETMDLDKEQKFWQNALTLSKEQFYKPSIRPVTKNSFIYASTNGHGTCSVYAFGVERCRKVEMGMRALLETIK